MKKSLIYASICLCLGGLALADVASAKNKNKGNSNCLNADVVLSKKYPNFDLNNPCRGAYSNSGECDPDHMNMNDDGTGMVIAGSSKSNVIHGSRGDDTICGGNGNDEIYGEDGDDAIYGDNGKDSLYGGLGNDEIHGGNGKDHLYGYDDVHRGETGYAADTDDDSIYGENGSDDMSGGPGDDTLSGGNGKDSMDGDDGTDDVSGDTGKDNCSDDDGDSNNECAETEAEDIHKHKGKDDNKDDDNGSSTSPSTAGDFAAGQAKFDADCSACHAAGSHDTSGINIAGDGNDLKSDLTSLGMPGITLTNQEIADLRTFLNSPSI
jgi:RTX calcium-binding nonapeptide repeat (4 copies)